VGILGPNGHSWDPKRSNLGFLGPGNHSGPLPDCLGIFFAAKNTFLGRFGSILGPFVGILGPNGPLRWVPHGPFGGFGATNMVGTLKKCFLGQMKFF